MPNATPIRTALAIAKPALLAASAAYATLRDGAPAAYWRAAPSGSAGWLMKDATRHLIIWQSQDAGGRSDLWVGEQGWTGLITLKVLASTEDAANAALVALPEPLILNAAGYALSMRWQHPLDIPDTDGVCTAAGLYRLTIQHTT